MLKAQNIWVSFDAETCKITRNELSHNESCDLCDLKRHSEKLWVWRTRPLRDDFIKYVRIGKDHVCSNNWQGPRRLRSYWNSPLQGEYNIRWRFSTIWHSQRWDAWWESGIQIFTLPLVSMVLVCMHEQPMTLLQPSSATHASIGVTTPFPTAFVEGK